MKIKFLTGIFVFLFLSGCEKTYKIEASDDFHNLKKAYRAGEKVKLYFDLIATDVDYTFWLDDKKISATSYDEKKGYIFEFNMPDHDVKLSFSMKNSMIYVEPDVLIVAYNNATLATAEGNFATELRLLTSDIENDKLIVKETGKDPKTFLIPEEKTLALLNALKKIDLSLWENADADPLDGSRTTLTFRKYNSSEYVEISTDALPEGGQKTLNEIGQLLFELLPPENKNGGE